VSGPVTSVARVGDVQIFLKDPVYIYIHIYTVYVLRMGYEYARNMYRLIDEIY